MFGGPCGIRTHDSRIKSPRAVRPTLGALRRICGEGQMALCEDESCGLARVTSDDRIVRGLTAWGKRCTCRFRCPIGAS